MPTNIEKTYGAMLIGGAHLKSLFDEPHSHQVHVMFAIFFQGVLTVQTYVYYENFPEDGRSLKVLVASVWLLDTTHMILISQTVFHYLVSNWGNDAALLGSTTPLNIHVLFVGFATILCQSFYLLRPNMDPQQKKLVADWFIDGSMPDLPRIPYPPCCIIHYVWRQIYTHSVSCRDHRELHYHSGRLVPHIFIHFTIDVFYLRTGAWKSSFEKTTSVINRVIQYTVATGVTTSLVAIAIVVAYQLAPNSFIQIAIHFSHGRLYTNALLAALNSRKLLRETLSGRSRMHSIHQFRTPVVVDVDVTQSTHRDEYSLNTVVKSQSGGSRVHNIPQFGTPLVVDVDVTRAPNREEYL
ncbi:hypothetical protein C8J57DRAFT_1493088 [Mycena rebaudengoi]|nr:hypothetical protein C8J57DRAFT_1493088 [Mycena rebaudengoi]